MIRYMFPCTWILSSNWPEGGVSLTTMSVGSRYCMYYYVVQFWSVQTMLLDGEGMYNPKQVLNLSVELLT